MQSVNSVYLSIPVSQFIPSSLSPLMFICLFSISVSLFLLCKQEICINFFRFPHTIFVFLFLTYFCMTVFRSILISTNDPISFLFMADIPWYICTYVSLSYSSHFVVATQFPVASTNHPSQSSNLVCQMFGSYYEKHKADMWKSQPLVLWNHFCISRWKHSFLES